MDFDDAVRLSSTLTVLSKRTGLGAYDFDFRRYLSVKSVRDFSISGKCLARIGPIADYSELYARLGQLGLQLMQSPTQHARVSDLALWYPLLQDLTPRSRVYFELPTSSEVGLEFGWPVFVKGGRQTNRHRASLSVARTPCEFDEIGRRWGADSVLHWQNMVCREWLSLVPVGDPVGDVVQPSKEVRAFFYCGSLVGWGPYWNGYSWRPSESEGRAALLVAAQAAHRLEVPFVAVDVACDVEGRWWVIECNDGQESGWAGVSPIALWQQVVASDASGVALPDEATHGT